MLDAKTFTTLIVLNLQSGVLPKQWLALTFNKIFNLTNVFKASPLSDEGNQVEQKPLFLEENADVKPRLYVDWKLLLTAFILIHSNVPTKEDLDTFTKKL